MPLRRRRGLGQIVEDTFAVYRRQFGPLFAIGALTIPYSVLTGVVQFSAGGFAGTLVSLGLTALGIGVYGVAYAAIVVWVTEADEGRLPDPGGAYRLALRRPAQLLSAIYMAIGVVIALTVTVIGIPIAVWLGIRWVFGIQAVVIDGRGGAQALRHSVRVVEGRWWNTLGRFLVISLISSIPQLAATVLFLNLSSPATVVLDALLSAATLPIVAVGMTLAYFDLRLEKGARLWEGQT